MKTGFLKKFFCLLFIAAMTALLAACGFAGAGESAGRESAKGPGAVKVPKDSEIDTSVSFAEAHDAFTTTLVKEENDDYSTPEPPEGLFELVSYPSKVGDLDAYVSSDPGDGEIHPMIIWIVGGWGNGIDDFPWVYPERDNDQTGSAFWQEGILTMYPSFRGGNGNPGYYETLFGEVDDVVSAYEYAASLPYVDPERIYLGGHSTGGTRALLASEYTDKFRAVFCFGAVDEIKYHNNSQFTFDTENEDEYIMRSPIYWLDSVKSPTFLIEGRDGNSENLERIAEASGNDNIHCYVVEGEDHFSVLAPATKVVAQKILEDTGAEPAITITQAELDEAKKQEMPAPVPVMTGRYVEELGLTFSCPYLWDINYSEEGNGLDIYSRYSDENAWDMAELYIRVYDKGDEENDLRTLKENMELQGYEVSETTIDEKPAVDGTTMLQDNNGLYYRRYISVECDEMYVDFNFTIYEDYMEEAGNIFQDIMESVRFDV